MDKQTKAKQNSREDAELVLQIKDGNYSVFAALLNKYMPIIVKNAEKYVSVISDEDYLIGEGVSALFSAALNYTEEKSSFKTFANLCIERAMGDVVKSETAKKRIPKNLVGSLDETKTPEVESPENIIIRKEENDNLLNALNSKLTPLERNVVYLFLRGESYAEISNILGTTLKSVDGAMRRVRKKLQK